MRRIVSSSKVFKVLPLCAALTATSCSVLEPVGGAISQGYENTVSYFNAYYNAQRLYDEAEDEVITYRLNQRGQRTLQGSAAQAVPGNSKAKFTLVIEKCSGILSFHESSALVDDALLLIGKSYYYQNDFLKAERKFEELLAQYPDGPLSMETQLWLLRCYAENGRRDEGLQLGEVLRSSALEDGEEETAGRAMVVLAHLEEETSPSTSLRYLSEAIPLLDDDLDQGDAQAKIGDLLIKLDRAEEAVVAYLKVPELTSDTYLRFYGMVHAARAYGALGRYDEALDLVNELLDDFTFSTYWNEVRFELAEAEARLGRLDEAVDDFTYIDTTAARTEYGTRAAFRKGWILEHEFGDYDAAKVAYGRAAAFTVPDVSTMARQRESALGQHRSLHQRLGLIDSVLAASEEAPSGPLDSAAAARPAPNPDSLRVEITKVHFQLGELFYAELEVPDSAVLYYRQVLAAPADTIRTPRVLFIMADLSLKHDLGTSSDSLYRVIIRDYPESPYAAVAKEALGIPAPKPQADPAKGVYASAEGALDSGNTSQAIELFDQIIEEYPESEYAAQSRYALGWVYEYVLSEPDSALSQYRLLVEEHGSSPFATRVKGKLAATEPAPPSPKDSVVLERIEKVEAPPVDRKPPTMEEAPAVPGTRRGRANEERPPVAPDSPPPKKKED